VQGRLSVHNPLRPGWGHAGRPFICVMELRKRGKEEGNESTTGRSGEGRSISPVGVVLAGAGGPEDDLPSHGETAGGEDYRAPYFSKDSVSERSILTANLDRKGED